MRRGEGRAVVRMLAIGGLIGVALALAACGDSDDDEATTEATGSETVTQISDPPRTSGFVGARVDVTGLECKQEDDRWTVSGTVTNPTGAPVDYRIFTSFLDPARDTAGLLQTDVKGVAAGAAKEWDGELPLKSADLDCVLRVERTDAGAP